MTSDRRNAFPPHVVAVDSRMQDYLPLAPLVQRRQIRLTFLTCGGSALRVADRFPDALWLVSEELPDLPGIDLLTMLKQTVPDLTVWLVDRQQNVDRERSAWHAGAAGYVCKPFSSDWFAAWRGSRPAPTEAALAPDSVVQHFSADPVRTSRHLSRIDGVRS